MRVEAIVERGGIVAQKRQNGGMLAILLMVVAQGLDLPDPGRRVDFRPDCGRLVNLAQPLTSALGTGVTISGELKHEVIAISATGVTRQRLAEKVAECLDAEWTADARGLILRRTPASVKRMKERELLGLSERITAKQSSLLETVHRQESLGAAEATLIAQAVEALTPEDYEDYGKLDALARKVPVGRWAARVLCLIPAAELAALPVGGRAVFHTRPNQRQVPMKVSRTILEGLKKDQAAILRKLPSASVPNPERWPLGSMFGRLPDGGMSIAVEVFSGGSAYYATVHFLDTADRSVAWARLPLEIYEAPRAPQSHEREVHRGPLADEFIEAYRKFRQGVQFELSSDLRNVLAQPDLHDPMAFGLTGAIRAMSEVDGKAVVMLADDALFFQSLGVSRGTSSSLGSFRQLLATSHCFIEEKDGWMLIRPERAEGSRIRGDRELTATWLSQALQGGPKSETTLRMFASHSEGFAPFTLIYYRLLCPQLADTSANQVFGRWPHLLASLSQTQRVLLEGGGSILVRDLALTPRRMVEELIYGGNTPLQYTGYGRDDGSSGSWTREPTELFPNGVPPDARLSLKVARGSAVFGLFDSPGPGTNGRVRRGPQDIGYQLAKEGSGLTLDPKAWPRRFGVCENLAYHFTLTLSPEWIATGEYRDNFIVPKEAGFDKLPEKFREQAQKWAQYYRERPDAPAPSISEHSNSPPS